MEKKRNGNTNSTGSNFKVHVFTSNQDVSDSCYSIFRFIRDTDSVFFLFVCLFVLLVEFLMETFEQISIVKMNY